MASLFCIIFLSFVCSATCDGEHGRIIGGAPVDITKAPYQVSLRCPKFNFCGGFIVTELHVMTAAHCTYNKQVGNLKIVAGTNYRSGDSGDFYDAEKVYVHEKYRETNNIYDYDISIIKVTKAIRFHDKVQKIVMAEPGLNIPDGTMLSVTGWGWMKEQSYEQSKVLLHVAVPKVNHEQCAKSYLQPPPDWDETIIITPRMLCAGLEGKSTCQGDSGGPLTMDSASGRKVVGIVNFAIGCARKNFPTGYASVAAYRSWIDKIINS